MLSARTREATPGSAALPAPRSLCTAGRPLAIQLLGWGKVRAIEKEVRGPASLLALLGSRPSPPTALADLL